MKKNTNGFTLIELLIGVLISVMIFIAAGSTIALLFRTDVKSKQKETLEQTKSDLVSDLSTSIRWSTDLSVSTSGNPTLTADTNTYTLEGGRILKNGDPLTTNDVVITRFNITDYSRGAEIKSLEILIGMESRYSSTVKDTAKIVVSQRQTVFEESGEE